MSTEAIVDAFKYLFKKGTQVGEEGVVEDLERKRFVPQEYLKEVTNDVSVEDSEDAAIEMQEREIYVTTRAGEKLIYLCWSCCGL